MSGWKQFKGFFTPEDLQEISQWFVLKPRQQELSNEYNKLKKLQNASTQGWQIIFLQSQMDQVQKNIERLNKHDRIIEGIKMRREQKERRKLLEQN